MRNLEISSLICLLLCYFITSVIKWKNKEKVTKNSVNKELTALMTGLNYAIIMGNLRHNPVAQVKRFKATDYKPAYSM